MECSNNLSYNLKALRQIRQKTQTEFAQELGISKSTLQEIEHGKNPNLDTLLCIANHLDIAPSLLLSNALPPTQLCVLTQLIRGMDWFSDLSLAKQEELLDALLQISRALSILKEN